MILIISSTMYYYEKYAKKYLNWEKYDLKKVKYCTIKYVYKPNTLQGAILVYVYLYNRKSESRKRLQRFWWNLAYKGFRGR